ncbi:MAG: dihydroorotate dehydrogenase electron transfer subunit [Kiritimatiellia bacterium]
MQDIIATLETLRPLACGYSVLTLKAPAIAVEAQPGQFIHLQIPTLANSCLRRPFSIYDADPVAGQISILYKVVGVGTRHLAEIKEGTPLNVLGPIGKPFPLHPQGTPFLVAGGYGVAPLWFLASRLPRKGILFVGGRTATDILETERFKTLGWDVRIATQDGSLGEQGLVTKPLDEALDKNPNAELYACGPDGMLRAVGERAITHNIRGWLSLDKHMVCGVGACLACVQKIRPLGQNAEILSRVCVDGPVFESREIVW